MAQPDQQRWNERYAASEAPAAPSVQAVFTAFADAFSMVSDALELACGAGQASVWLAQHGVQVCGYDISAVAIAQAKTLAEQHGVSASCRFESTDLDAGLPAGAPVDLVLCHLFRDARLDQPMLDRLRPGGLIAVAALSEVGAAPGRFRVPAGELTRAFSACELLGHDEGDGVAWIVGHKK